MKIGESARRAFDRWPFVFFLLGVAYVMAAIALASVNQVLGAVALAPAVITLIRM